MAFSIEVMSDYDKFDNINQRKEAVANFVLLVI